VYGGGYYLVGYNFLPNEAGVYAYMYTSSYTSYMIGSLYIRSSGAGVRYFTGPLCATGTYAIYFSRVYTPPEPILVDVVPTAEISPEEGRPGDLIELNIWGLEAGGSYVIVWDALGDPTPVPNSAFMAGQDGDRTDLWFEVPSVPEGTYAISVAPASDPTSPVDLYDQEGNVAYPEFDVRPEIEFNPAGEYIPYQLVTFSWDIGRDPDAEGEQVLITLDGTPIFNGIISPDMIQGASSSATVNWEDGVIKGSFIMPNGPPDEELELKIRAGTDTAVGTLTRVSGAGSMLLGVELANDIAYIKGKSDTIVASLSDLRVEIEDISKDVVYLRTNMGDMITTLENINAAVVSVSNDMATLRTDVGTITTKLENVASIITSSKEDIMSEIGSKTSKVLESTSVLGAKINTVSETVDSIKGTVSTIPAQISAVSDNVQSVNTEVKNITMYLYVIMSLLALAIAVTIVMGLIRR
jgi:archaellum component FlaC